MPPSESVAVPLWVKQAIDGWLETAGIEKGPIFRRVSTSGRVGEDALTQRAVWQLVREYAAQVGIGELAPHDLRRYAESGLCRIGYEACAFGAELAHQNDQVDSA
jgi:integrase